MGRGYSNSGHGPGASLRGVGGVNETVFSPAIIQGVLAARDSVDPDDCYESYCYDASEAVQIYLQSQGISSTLSEAGTVRDFSHVYLFLEDGTIIDPTLDQFYPGGRGNVTGDWTNVPAFPDGLPHDNPWMESLAIIPPEHPFAQHYISHRLDNETESSQEGYWITGQEPQWWKKLHQEHKAKAVSAGGGSRTRTGIYPNRF
jgi:hypothetical protein